MLSTSLGLSETARSLNTWGLHITNKNSWKFYVPLSSYTRPTTSLKQILPNPNLPEARNLKKRNAQAHPKPETWGSHITNLVRRWIWRFLSFGGGTAWYILISFQSVEKHWIKQENCSGGWHFLKDSVFPLLSEWSQIPCYAQNNMLKIGLKSRDMFIHAIYKQYAVSSNSAVVAETVNVYVHT